MVCIVDGYVTTSLYYCLLEGLVNDVLYQVYNNRHIYTHIHTHILRYIHTHPSTYKKFSLQYIIVAVWWYLVITSLTYNILTIHWTINKLEKLIAIKRKKNKLVNEICSKESNNLYKIKTTTNTAGLIFHSDTEQIYFIRNLFISLH